MPPPAHSSAWSLERATELLRQGSGLPEAAFRDGQAEAIRHVVEGQGRLLVVQRTGWGKSFVYFIATKLLREAGRGPALLVSPLLALMRNQIAAAERMGVRAATIHSGNEEAWHEVEAALARDEVDILLISPERLANERFRRDALGAVRGRLALLVIDEAHCISDWGHDFRPHYRLLQRIVTAVPEEVGLLATTATANDRVTADLVEVLGPRLMVSRGELGRPSLKLQTVRLPDHAERLAWLAEQLPRLEGSGIVYTLTVRDAERVASWLRSRGLAVQAYTGESGDAREALEDDLLHDRVKALVATTALGMGYDKPDLAFVVHYQAPSSVVAYYQQVGRAGRGLQAAYGVLLAGAEDTDIGDFFIEGAFPTRAEAEAVLAALDDHPEGLSARELLGHVNVGYGRVDKTLKLLSLEHPAPLVKERSKYRRTGQPLSEAFWERTERLTTLRREEQAEMQRYVDLDQGHMAFLIEALDGDASQVVEPDLAPLPTSTDPDLVQAAIEFLDRADLPIEPRRQWPAGGLVRSGVKGRLAEHRRAREGRALALLGDAGRGRLVAAGRRAGRFDDALVTACAELLERWRPDPAPTWVTCVPSQRAPGMVRDLAERLAATLELPFVPAITRIDGRPTQASLANAVQQARNVDGAFAVDREVEVPATPVLLVDDTVASRWTFTMVAHLLRETGCRDIWPLALAMVRGGG